MEGPDSGVANVPDSSKACICGEKDGLLSQGAAPAMLLLSLARIRACCELPGLENRRGEPRDGSAKKIDESTVRMEVPDSGVANVPDPSEKPGVRGLDGRGLQ
jgi:hypothetical protein